MKPAQLLRKPDGLLAFSMTRMAVYRSATKSSRLKNSGKLMAADSAP